MIPPPQDHPVNSTPLPRVLSSKPARAADPTTMPLASAPKFTFMREKFERIYHASPVPRAIARAMTALPKHPPQTTTITEKSLPNIMHSATTSMPSLEICALNVQVSGTVPSHTQEYTPAILEPPASNPSSKAHNTIDVTFEASSSALGLEIPVASVPAATIHDSSTDLDASMNSVSSSNPLDPVGPAPTDMASVDLDSSNQGSSGSVAFPVVIPNKHWKTQKRTEAKPKRRDFPHSRGSASKKLAPISSISDETYGRPHFLDDVRLPKDKAVLDQASMSATGIELDNGESTNIKLKAGTTAGNKSRRRHEVVTDSNAAPHIEARNRCSSSGTAMTARQFPHARNGGEQRRVTSKSRALHALTEPPGTHVYKVLEINGLKIGKHHIPPDVLEATGSRWESGRRRSRRHTPKKLISSSDRNVPSDKDGSKSGTDAATHGKTQYTEGICRGLKRKANVFDFSDEDIS